LYSCDASKFSSYMSRFKKKKKTLELVLLEKEQTSDAGIIYRSSSLWNQDSQSQEWSEAASL